MMVHEHIANRFQALLQAGVIGVETVHPSWDASIALHCRICWASLVAREGTGQTHLSAGKPHLGNRLFALGSRSKYACVFSCRDYRALNARATVGVHPALEAAPDSLPELACPSPGIQTLSVHSSPTFSTCCQHA